MWLILLMINCDFKIYLSLSAKQMESNLPIPKLNDHFMYLICYLHEVQSTYWKAPGK